MRFFPQVVRVIERYIATKVQVEPPNKIKDLWLSPWYGLAIEGLAAAIHPDSKNGEAPEVPRYESNRGPGSTADVDFFTKRDMYPDLILETKGYDPLTEAKRAAAERWIAAVNADGCYGTWYYALVRKVTDVTPTISRITRLPEQQLRAVALISSRV